MLECSVGGAIAAGYDFTSSWTYCFKWFVRALACIAFTMHIGRSRTKPHEILARRSAPKRPRFGRLPSKCPQFRNPSRSKVKGNRVVFGSGVSIGSGTMVLPSAHLSPEAQVGDNRLVGALATSAHPTGCNRCLKVAPWLTFCFFRLCLEGCKMLESCAVAWEKPHHRSPVFT